MSRVVRKLKNGELRFSKEAQYMYGAVRTETSDHEILTDEAVDAKIFELKKEIDQIMQLDLSMYENINIYDKHHLFATRVQFLLEPLIDRIKLYKKLIRKINKSKSEIENKQRRLFSKLAKQKNNEQFMDRAFSICSLYLANRYQEKINYIKATIAPYKAIIEETEQEISKILTREFSDDDKTKIITYMEFRKMEDNIK